MGIQQTLASMYQTMLIIRNAIALLLRFTLFLLSRNNPPLSFATSTTTPLTTGTLLTFNLLALPLCSLSFASLPDSFEPLALYPCTIVFPLSSTFFFHINNNNKYASKPRAPINPCH
ncbi:MAG: hypothetical protein JOS17DRAFT_216361 [Linnemannia elongata]|nr:MAG: hypothetical protein JOS17DRAFT_216361 [Linnemannia elongata]